jgi:ADP-ribose pyrophosphatase
MKKWQKINTRLLLKHARLSVYEDEIILPAGEHIQYLRYGAASDSVVIIAQQKDGRILVQKEYSYPPDQWLLQFPGGKVEEHESTQEAATRELAEETNITGSLKEIGWFYTDNRRSASKMYVFTATNLIPAEGTPDLEELFENNWLGEKTITKYIATGKIVNYSLLSAWSIYDSHFNNRL